MTRSTCITQKVPTDFGNFYIQIDLNAQAHPVGGCISTPGKEPDSQIHRLIETLSEGLDSALAMVGREP